MGDAVKPVAREDVRGPVGVVWEEIAGFAGEDDIARVVADQRSEGRPVAAASAGKVHADEFGLFGEQVFHEHIVDGIAAAPGFERNETSVGAERGVGAANTNEGVGDAGIVGDEERQVRFNLRRDGEDEVRQQIVAVDRVACAGEGDIARVRAEDRQGCHSAGQRRVGAAAIGRGGSSGEVTDEPGVAGRKVADEKLKGAGSAAFGHEVRGLALKSQPSRVRAEDRQNGGTVSSGDSRRGHGSHDVERDRRTRRAV